MEPTLLQRLQAAISALAATAVLVVPIGQASAGDESPFGKAVQLADADLGNQRGGFAASDGSLLPFGFEVDLQSDVNGKQVAELSIQKGKDGGFQASMTNFGHTVAVESQPNPQGTDGSTGSTGGQKGPTLSPTGPVVPSTTRTGDVLATTMLLPSGNGVMTLIQNAQSNVAIHALQTLNIKLTGVNADMLRNIATANGFANALRASARR